VFLGADLTAPILLAQITSMGKCIILVAWFINVLIFSFVLSIVEILLEREKGWASGLNPNGWGKKLLNGGIIARLCEKPYITTYHVFVFMVVMPAFFLAEYSLLRLGIVSRVISSMPDPSKSYFLMTIGNTKLNPLWFLIAVWFSFLAVEDFFWFTFNWYYPRSLEDLLTGNIWWHTRWVNFGSVKLPRFYLSVHLLSAFSLFASLYLSG
jgi:hypothetical protein